MSIYKNLRKYDEVKAEVESFVKSQQFCDQEWQSLDIKDQMTKQYLSDYWIDSSKNLSKWEELSKVAEDTENYELKLECAKVSNDFKKKLLLLESDCRHKNESEGIVDLTTILLDNVDLKNNDLLKQRN